MKKSWKILKSSILSGLFCLLLTANGWSKDGKLTDISRPYLGTYECEKLYFGSEDKLKDFEYLRVELLSDGEMKLLFKEKGKEVKTFPLSYEFDTESNTLTVRAKWGVVKAEKKVPIEKGEINAVFTLGKFNIIAKFKK